jgi:hypothetical protein
MTYKVIYLHDGEVVRYSLPKLSQDLCPNTMLCEYVKGELTRSYPITQADVVKITLQFAEYSIRHYCKTSIPAAEDCNALTLKWLKNAHSVSNEELKVAASAAVDGSIRVPGGAPGVDAAYAAAANAAVHASAHAAHAAAGVVGAASAAVYYAADAARAYALASGADAVRSNNCRDAQYTRQGEFILEYLRTGSI